MQTFSESNIIFGILSSVFVFGGLFPYFIGIRNKKIHPHILSWTGWGFVTGLGSVAMLSEGFTWGVVIIAANTIACFAIAIYAQIKKVGTWRVSLYDYGLFILGFIGLVLWQISNDPDLAIFFAIVADLSFGIPTLIKIYKNPYSETIFPWVMTVLAGFSGLLAVSYISFTEIAYPVYLAIYDFSALFLILFIRKYGWHKREKRKQLEM